MELLSQGGRLIVAFIGMFAVIIGGGGMLAAIWTSKVVSNDLNPSGKLAWIIFCLVMAIALIILLLSLIGWSASGTSLQNF
jgi:phosphate/sulfate permease